MKSWKSYEGYEELLPNHVFIQRVARAAGVSNQSVHRMAKKRLEKEGKRDRKRLDGCPYTFVSLDLWDTYMQIGSVQRVPTKPKGWVTAKALLEDGFSKRKLYQFVNDGQIKAVYVGNTLYLDPDSAKGYLQSRQNLRPPPGWVSVSELRERAGRSKQAIFTYLKRHDIATKQFLHPKRDQLVQYLRQEDATAYLESIHALTPEQSEASQAVHEDVTVEQPANPFDLSSYTPEINTQSSAVELQIAEEESYAPFMLPGYAYTHPDAHPYALSKSAQRYESYEDLAW
jgi:hypothetical protein